MITMGFTFGYSDVVTLDTDFPQISSYIYVHGSAGDIVFMNSAGELQYLPNAGLGYHPISAKQILLAGTVNGTPRNTTATGLVYCSSGKY